MIFFHQHPPMFKTENNFWRSQLYAFESFGASAPKPPADQSISKNILDMSL